MVFNVRYSSTPEIHTGSSNINRSSINSINMNSIDTSIALRDSTVVTAVQVLILGSNIIVV